MTVFHFAGTTSVASEPLSVTAFVRQRPSMILAHVADTTSVPSAPRAAGYQRRRLQAFDEPSVGEPQHMYIGRRLLQADGSITSNLVQVSALRQSVVFQRALCQSFGSAFQNSWCSAVFPDVITKHANVS